MGHGRLLAQTFHSFTVPSYRWLWTNMVGMSLAMNMEMLAQGWLVLELTDSPLWLGAVAGSRGAGMLTFGALGGVIADRVDRRRALAAMQAARALILLAQGLLVTFGLIDLWHVFIAVTLQGLLQAMVMPLSNALVYDVVGPKRLLNAMATRVTAFNLSRIVGSIIAGVMISEVSVGGSYLLVAGIAVLTPATLWPVKGGKVVRRAAEPLWQNLVGGLSYARRSGSLRTLLSLSILVEMFGFSYVIMLPVIARDVLEVGASGLGYLSAAGGAGALVGSIGIATLGDFRGKVPVMLIAGGAAGVLIALFALSPWFGASLPLVAAAGGALMAYDATMATLLQLLSTDEMRARIQGLYAFTFGFNHLGGFLTGVVAAVVSAPFAVSVGGGAIAVYVLLISRAGRGLAEPGRHQEGDTDGAGDRPQETR